MSLFGEIHGVATSLIPYSVERGIAFRAFDRLVIAGSSTQYWSALLPPDKAVILFSRRISSSKPGLTYEALSGSTGITYSSGVTVLNLNAISNKVSGSLIRRVTAITPGTVFDFDEVIGAGGSGSNSVGGSISEEGIRILPPGAEFALRLVNGDPEPASASLYLQWIEIPPAALSPN